MFFDCRNFVDRLGFRVEIEHGNALCVPRTPSRQCKGADLSRRARIVNPHYDGLGTSPLTTRG